MVAAVAAVAEEHRIFTVRAAADLARRLRCRLLLSPRCRCRIEPCVNAVGTRGRAGRCPCRAWRDVAWRDVPWRDVPWCEMGSALDADAASGCGSAQ